MKKLWVALAPVLILAMLSSMRSSQQVSRATIFEPPKGPTLDKYGGLPDLPCSNKSGHFVLTKLGRRWYFCDPLGHSFISMSVANVGPNSNPTPDCQGKNTYPTYRAKYGDVGENWGWQTLKRMENWGFNTLGEDSGDARTFPWATCRGCAWPKGVQPVPMPIIPELKPSMNGSVNREGFLASPIKDELSGTNRNYKGYRGGALYDAFDPNLSKEWQGELAKPAGVVVKQIRDSSPYILGVLTEDSDFFWGSGAGPDFNTGGHTAANIAWVTLITAPVRTYIKATQFMNKPFLYSPQEVHSKTQAVDPKEQCSISSPCSLRDYLWQRYTKGPIPSCAKASTGIAALNACWGSNYTTFDSTGTQVTGESVGTGNGSTQTFARTLAHSPVSPFTVLISVGGTSQVGDCPWFDASSNCPAVTANTGTLGSPTANYINQTASTINYTTGAISITFVTPPASGAAITVNYIYGGWMAGGTGLMDEDGSHTTWVGTNPYCLEGADPNFPTYFACVGGGGGAKPVPNANPNLGADLDNWESQFVAKYFKTMHDGLKAVSSVPYLGMDSVGSWGGPAYSKFLEGMAPYVDAGFFSSLAPYWTTTNAEFLARYQYATRYFGDVPFINWGVINAESDSSMSCHPPTGSNTSNFSTQEARGQAWYNWVSTMLSTPGYNNTFPLVGFNWWSWQDFQNSNQGLVSIHDNAYDGHEDVTGSVPCSPPLEAFSCGGETANYGDAISRIRAANLLWLSLPSETAPTDHPARK